MYSAEGLRKVTPAVCPNKAVAVSYAQLVVCFDYFCVLSHFKCRLDGQSQECCKVVGSTGNAGRGSCREGTEGMPGRLIRKLCALML